MVSRTSGSIRVDAGATSEFRALRAPGCASARVSSARLKSRSLSRSIWISFSLTRRVAARPVAGSAGRTPAYGGTRTDCGTNRKPVSLPPRDSPFSRWHACLRQCRHCRARTRGPCVRAAERSARAKYRRDYCARFPRFRIPDEEQWISSGLVRLGSGAPRWRAHHLWIQGPPWKWIMRRCLPLFLTAWMMASISVG
jgi:hypothetical protein